MGLRRTALLVALAGTVAAGQPVLAGVEEQAPAGHLVAATVVAPALLTSGEPDPDAARRLGERVRAALGGHTATTLAARVDVEGLGTVFARSLDHALPPASTQKSFVGAAALAGLPAGHRWRTEVATTGVPAGGRLAASLWLVAGGDPYLTDAGLRSLARSVRAAGITSITGNVYLDDSRYDALREPAGWKPDFMPGEAGPLSAMSVDRNAYRDDASFLADPAFPAAVRFRALLRAEGVGVPGTVKRLRRPAHARTVAERVSGPVDAVLRRVLKDSDNYAAELVLKEVGRVVRGEGSTAAGLAAVRQLLGERGVAVGAGSDGSGLSRYDRQTVRQQVALLDAVAASPTGPAFRAALPIACRDGTLKTRMCGTAAEGRVSAKTGTLTGVRALAGWTRTSSGRTVTFAFQLTGTSSGTAARNAIDRAVAVLAAAPE